MDSRNINRFPVIRYAWVCPFPFREAERARVPFANAFARNSRNVVLISFSSIRDTLDRGISIDPYWPGIVSISKSTFQHLGHLKLEIQQIFSFYVFLIYRLL